MFFNFLINISQPNYCHNFTTIMLQLFYFVAYKFASVRFTLNEHDCVCVCVKCIRIFLALNLPEYHKTSNKSPRLLLEQVTSALGLY